jgi:adenosylcobinamide-phosphate synthase
VVLCISTLAVTAGVISAILICLERLNFYAFVAGCVYFIYAGLAARCLASESKKTADCLTRGDITAARTQIGMLVGRDTDKLDEGQIIKAAVETTAENTADGVISPLFWLSVGIAAGRLAFGSESLNALITGVVLMWLFKAASTLDSVVGYKDERYIEFGCISARADDFFNFIPARLTGLLYVSASAILFRRGARCARIMFRDHSKHASPNSGWPEAAAAGALGIELGGTASYRGVAVEKPIIGDGLKAPSIDDIHKVIKIMWACEAQMLLIIVSVLTVLEYCSQY